MRENNKVDANLKRAYIDYHNADVEFNLKRGGWKPVTEPSNDLKKVVRAFETAVLAVYQNNKKRKVDLKAHAYIDYHYASLELDLGPVNESSNGLDKVVDAFELAVLAAVQEDEDQAGTDQLNDDTNAP